MSYAGESPVAYLPVSIGTEIKVVETRSGPRLDLWDPSGIGEAMFWIMDLDSATDLSIRLHLRGLEELTIVFGEHIFRAGVSSYGERTVQEALLSTDDTETELTAGSPYWAQITPGEVVNGMPAHFDVALPPALFEDDGLFRLRWIDFYR